MNEAGQSVGNESLDHLAIAVAVLFGALATVVGLRTGFRVQDVDETVFRQTLLMMRHGAGYYHAMRAALVAKEGAPPSQIRSIRPPTIYLVLSLFPPGSWRWLAGLPMTAATVLAARIGRPLHRAGALVAAVAVGVWMLGATKFLFLHAELWGLPFLLGGIVLLRRRPALGVACLVAATSIRELYGIALLAGLVLDRANRRAWAIGSVAAVGLAVAHSALALQVLASSGREAGFREHALGWRLALSAISPANRPVGWAAGLGFGGCGIIGLIHARHADPPAPVTLAFVGVMALLTLTIGRQYWGLVFGPAAAAYAGGVLPLVQRERLRPGRGG